jgi:hypothetical protein
MSNRDFKINAYRRHGAVQIANSRDWRHHIPSLMLFPLERFDLA